MSTLLALAFLLVFSLFSTTALKSYTLKRKELSSLKSAFVQELKHASERETAIFEGLSEVNEPKEPKDTESYTVVKSDQDASSEKKSGSPKPRRDHYKSGINLYDLLGNSIDKKPLEKVFYSLFEKLYSKEDFYYESLSSDLLSVWRTLATGSKSVKNKKRCLKDPLDLAELDVKDPKLALAHYKILKGCRVEDEEGGYPSICDYLIVHTYPAKINLYRAPKELLTALYDESVAEYILSQKEKWKSSKNSRTTEFKEEEVLNEISSYYGKPSKFQSLVIFSPHSK